MSGEVEIDVYTKQPRRPYLPYSKLTDEQIKNIHKDPKPFFVPPNKQFVERGRQFQERYTEMTSTDNLRDLNGHAIPDGSLHPGVASPQKISGSRVCEESKTSPWSVKQTGATRAGSERGPWGPFYHEVPDPVGSRTFSYGMEPVAQADKAALARCNERNLTALSGPVIMKYGRPNTNYYVQRHPQDATWTGSSCVLNQTAILQSAARPRTFAEYEAEAAAERSQERKAIEAREWPPADEYTDRFLLHSGTEKRHHP